MNNKTIKVRDTITGEIVDVEVSLDIYKAYMRTAWNIHDNNETFFEHEIQFSQLIGGDNGAFENFKEFIIDGDPTANQAIFSDIKESLRKCIEQLKPSEAKLIIMMYYYGMSEQNCAARLNTTRQNIHNKHRRILDKMHKLLDL